MPVQDVHLVHLHEIEVVKDDALRNEVSGRVDHHAAPREAGVVQHLARLHLVLEKTDVSMNIHREMLVFAAM